jgi:hypothetical protein
MIYKCHAINFLGVSDHPRFLLSILSFSLVHDIPPSDRPKHSAVGHESNSCRDALVHRTQTVEPSFVVDIVQILGDLDQGLHRQGVHLADRVHGNTRLAGREVEAGIPFDRDATGQDIEVIMENQ